MSEEKIEIKDVDQDSQLYRVMELAMEAGRILLRNGAEIFRVEETIDHICYHFGIEEMESFVLSNGIFLTAHQKGKESYARVKHIPLGGTNLEIVTAVNSLSREISAGQVTLDEAFDRLKEIEKIPPKKNSTFVLAAGIGSGVFGYILGGNIADCVMIFFIAGLLQMFILWCLKHHVSKIIINLIGGALITALALVVLNLKLPFMVNLDKMIIGSILPLVPGVLFVNAIRDIADSDFISGLVKLLDALLVFVYIATGVGSMLSIYEGIIGGVML